LNWVNIRKWFLSAKRNPPQRKPRRSDDQAKITVSLPKKLKTTILQEPKKENRPTSNYLVTVLKDLVEAADENSG
jgi:hypothetical protein